MMALPTKRLGDLVLEAKPGFACGEEAEDGIFQMRMNNITRDGRLDLSKRRLVPAQRPGMADFLLREGDVLFNATNSPDMVGKTALINATDEPTVFSNHFLRLRVDPSILLPAYLSRWLHLQFDRGTFKGMCRQWVNQATVGRDGLLRLAVPLPSLGEQRRIAEALDRADELRTKRRETLSHLNDLNRSIFLDMFATEASDEWAAVTVADVAHHRKGSIRTGPFGSQLLHSEFVDDGVAVLGIDNAVSNEFRWDERRFISEEKYQQLARYTVHPGDVLITIMGTCGRCAVVPDDIPRAINTKHLCCITLDSDRCLPEFLHGYFLTHPTARRYLQQTAKGAIMAGLNMEIIKAMPVVLPPLALQQAFVKRLRSVERVRAVHRASLVELDELFGALQDRAFRGLL
ncbi:restriction endonuclease subunit S [Micromonospora aurantiaca (nom. illeg.)]|uniref:restriction endonuclease subunit S n=1 Tax=Micromonospora aurantiaca (nom. illeg.) TaxID=47850 RepID=UPI00082935AA|nr:restriction endonuclease subunit S [Micromonospora aurantiaca]SCL40133.1 type I restriction enzyme, S subunit [Micromonospora aurantiaca]